MLPQSAGNSRGHRRLADSEDAAQVAQAVSDEEATRGQGHPSA
jgi:hypothetical protein